MSDNVTTRPACPRGVSPENHGPMGLIDAYIPGNGLTCVFVEVWDQLPASLRHASRIVLP